MVTTGPIGRQCQRVAPDPAAEVDARGQPCQAPGMVGGDRLASRLFEGFAQEDHLAGAGELGPRPAAQDGLLDRRSRQRLGPAACKPLRGGQEGLLAGFHRFGLGHCLPARIRIQPGQQLSV